MNWLYRRKMLTGFCRCEPFLHTHALMICCMPTIFFLTIKVVMKVVCLRILCWKWICVLRPQVSVFRSEFDACEATKCQSIHYILLLVVMVLTAGSLFSL